MKSPIKYASFIISFAALAIVVGVLSSHAPSAKADAGGNINVLPASYMKFATTSVSSSAASLVLTASNGRSWATISNEGSYGVYLYLYPSTTSLPFYANQPPINASSTFGTPCGLQSCPTSNIAGAGGIYLNASSSYTIALDNLYQGPVYAIGATSNAVVVSATANQ